jgi:hypothetical protein
MKKIFNIIGNIYMAICTIAVTVYFIFYIHFILFGIDKMKFLDISNGSNYEQISYNEIIFRYNTFNNIK